MYGCDWFWWPISGDPMDDNAPETTKTRQLQFAITPKTAPTANTILYILLIPSAVAWRGSNRSLTARRFRPCRRNNIITYSYITYDGHLSYFYTRLVLPSELLSFCFPLSRRLYYVHKKLYTYFITQKSSR